MARSIKFSDDTFLDFSGITKGQKTLDNIIKTDSTKQTFTAPNIKNFCIQVVTYFHDNGYDFFIGNVGWSGQDTFKVIFVSNVAFIFTTDIYFARYINASTIFVVKADATSL